MTATLTSSVTSKGVSGETVSFTLNGTSVGTAVTNSNGVATLTGVANSDAAGTYSGVVAASFAGDTDYAATSATGNLVVAPNACVGAAHATSSDATPVAVTYHLS